MIAARFMKATGIGTSVTSVPRVLKQAWLRGRKTFHIVNHRMKLFSDSCQVDLKSPGNDMTPYFPTWDLSNDSSWCCESRLFQACLVWTHGIEISRQT